MATTAAMQPLSSISFLVAMALLVSAGETYPLFHLCGSNGNFTSNSTYWRNLNAVMAFITSNTAIHHGYYNVSYGQGPDEVRAAALCRGDIKAADCRACIKESWHNIMQYCPAQKEATIYSELCTMRYSYALNSSQINPTFSMRKVKEIEVHVDEFNHVLAGLLDRLKTRAAAGSSRRKFAVGNVTLTDSLTIFSMVQCTPHQSKEMCNSCLGISMLDLLKNCNGTEGCRVIKPSCSIRYEIYCFYDTHDYASPPSPSQLRLPSSLSSSRYRFYDDFTPPTEDSPPPSYSDLYPPPPDSDSDLYPPPPDSDLYPPPPDSDSDLYSPPPDSDLYPPPPEDSPPMPSPPPPPPPPVAPPPTSNKGKSGSNYLGLKIGIPVPTIIILVIAGIIISVTRRLNGKAKSTDDTGTAASVHHDVEGTPKSTTVIMPEEKRSKRGRSDNVVNKTNIQCFNFGVGRN